MKWLSLLLLLTPGAALAAETPAEAGRALAQEICAACHDIGHDGGMAPIMNPPAPSFATLARKHKLDATHLRALLAEPHGRNAGDTKMPNPMLADYQIDALVAYLRSTRLGR